MSVAVGTTSAQTPLASNFGGLKAHVAAYVQAQNQPGPLADAGAGINAGIDRLNTRNWHWLNRQSDLTLVADTRTVTVPANFKRPRKLEKLDTNSKVVGWYGYIIPKEFIDANFSDVASGQPSVYTVRNATDDRLLTFDVPPSSAFVASWPTARLTYFSRLQHMANDGDTLGGLEAPPELRNFLVWYGRWEMATMRGTAQQTRDAREAWMGEWAALMRDDTNEQTDWQVRGRH
jgi:hypothetical protein